MNKYLKYIAPIVIGILSSLLFSCRSSQELIYLTNAQNNETLYSLNDTLTQYLLKPGDILYVSIKSMNAEVNAVFNPESNMEMSASQGYQKFTTPQGAYLYGFEVNEKGSINLPILGDVKVAKLTQEEAQAAVQKAADHYMKDSQVKVKLLNYKVTVMGEVKKPGIYYNYNNEFTVLEAIAQANGNTDFANINRVTVIRHEATGEKVMHLDMADKNIWLNKGFYLHPGDYVIVEPSKHKNLQLNSQAYSLGISSLSLLLAVLGLIF